MRRVRQLPKILAILMLVWGFAGPATPAALAVQKGVVRYHSFPVTPVVRQQMWFWEGIFGKYDNETVLIHSSRYPHLIVDIVEFKVFSKKYRKGAPYSRKEKSALVKRYIKRYELGIRRFRAEGRKAARHGAMEKRLLTVFSRGGGEAARDLMKGDIRLRSQTGLANEFDKAALRVRKYMPHMEEIFRKHKLPVELTRIVFVESMFNVAARSKVGASGVWQFMPKTARRFMTVNRYVDERNSPLKATEGAARLLKDNMRELRAWPLAITAYNHGVNGMKRARRRLGTTHFDKIIRKYKSRSFGFASRNFYAEFLAARNIYRKKYSHLRLQGKEHLGIVPVDLRKRVSVARLLKLKGVNSVMLKQHDNGLRPSAFGRYRNWRLPSGFRIYVPTKSAAKIRRELRKL